MIDTLSTEIIDADYLNIVPDDTISASKGEHEAESAGMSSKLIPIVQDFTTLLNNEHSWTTIELLVISLLNISVSLLHLQPVRKVVQAGNISPAYHPNDNDSPVKKVSKNSSKRSMVLLIFGTLAMFLFGALWFFISSVFHEYQAQGGKINLSIAMDLDELRERSKEHSQQLKHMNETLSYKLQAYVDILVDFPMLSKTTNDALSRQIKDMKELRIEHRHERQKMKEFLQGELQELRNDIHEVRLEVAEKTPTLIDEDPPLSAKNGLEKIVFSLLQGQIHNWMRSDECRSEDMYMKYCATLERNNFDNLLEKLLQQDDNAWRNL
jgi:gas vesicle protein